MPQCGEDLAWLFQDFRNRVYEPQVIARSMSFDRRLDRRHDVRRIAMSRKKNFDTRARGLRSLNENEFVFVR
jgi:hypothetical protein